MANGNTIARSYDKDGNLAEIENKNSDGVFSSFAYQYDKNGNRTAQIEEDGAATKYSYDALNRLTEIIYPKEKIEGLRNEPDQHSSSSSASMSYPSS